MLSADTISNVCSADGGGNGGNLTELLNHAVAILSCDTTPATLLGLDVATGAVLWTHPLRDTSTDPTTTDAAGASTAETVLPGPGSHVYLLDVTRVPATGLAAAYTTRTITALDEHSGDQSWTQPLEAEDRQDSGNGGTVLETPGPGDGATQVLVILDEYSSFDAATGKPLWRRATPDNQPTYVGYNLALSTAPSDTGDATNLTATNLATGKPAWSTALANGQSAVTSDSGSYTGQLAGHTYWTFAATGYDTFDVLTGKHTGHAVYPARVDAHPSHPHIHRRLRRRDAAPVPHRQLVAARLVSVRSRDHTGRHVRQSAARPGRQRHADPRHGRRLHPATRRHRRQQRRPERPERRAAARGKRHPRTRPAELSCCRQAGVPPTRLSRTPSGTRSVRHLDREATAVDTRIANVDGGNTTQEQLVAPAPSPSLP